MAKLVKELVQMKFMIGSACSNPGEDFVLLGFFSNFCHFSNAYIIFSYWEFVADSVI